MQRGVAAASRSAMAAKMSKPTALARRMAAAIRAAGGKVLYTEYAGVDHNTAGRMCGDAKVIEWLLKQKRKAPKPKAPKGGSKSPDDGKPDKKAE